MSPKDPLNLNDTVAFHDQVSEIGISLQKNVNICILHSFLFMSNFDLKAHRFVATRINSKKASFYRPSLKLTQKFPRKSHDSPYGSYGLLWLPRPQGERLPQTSTAECVPYSQSLEVQSVSLAMLRPCQVCVQPVHLLALGPVAPQKDQRCLSPSLPCVVLMKTFLDMSSMKIREYLFHQYHSTNGGMASEWTHSKNLELRVSFLRTWSISVYLKNRSRGYPSLHEIHASRR